MGSLLTGPDEKSETTETVPYPSGERCCYPILVRKGGPLADTSDTEQQEQTPYPAFPPASIENAHVIRSTHRARHAGASNGSAKYCASRTTLPAWNSMMLTVLKGRPP